MERPKEYLEYFERPRLVPVGRNFRLVEDWYTDCRGVLSSRLRIPSGFVTDGASVPVILWPVCGTPMELPRLYAAVVHDYLYSTHVGEFENDGYDRELRYVDRKSADMLYRDFLIALGVSKVKAYVEYYAARLFGESHWEN